MDLIDFPYLPEDPDDNQGNPLATSKTSTLIEAIFLPFSIGQHPASLLLTLIALGNILFWIAFIATNYHHWKMPDFLVLWIIPLGTYFTIDSWDKFLYKRAWSRACRRAYLVLDSEVDFWLIRQWSLLEIYRKGDLAPKPDGTIGQTLAEAIETRLETVNFWLRNKIVDEFTRIELATALGPYTQFSDELHNRIIGKIHYHFNEKLHGEHEGEFWWRLLVNIGVLLAVWIVTDLNH